MSTLTTQPYGFLNMATSVMVSKCVFSNCCCAALIMVFRGGFIGCGVDGAEEPLVAA